FIGHLLVPEHTSAPICRDPANRASARRKIIASANGCTYPGPTPARGSSESPCRSPTHIRTTWAGTRRHAGLLTPKTVPLWVVSPIASDANSRRFVAAHCGRRGNWLHAELSGTWGALSGVP